jgi:glycosyl transferase family 25
MLARYKTIVISLVDQAERRSRMQKQLDAAGFDWFFLDGVKGSELGSYPKDYDRQRRLAYYGYDLSWGELGCLLSHRKAWQTVCDLDQTCLILEDDVTLLPHLQDCLDLANRLDGHWDLFRLHSGQDKRPIKIAELGYLTVFENLDDPGSAAAFLIKPSAARALIEKSAPFFMMNDDFVEARFLHRQRILAVRPYPFEAGWGDTTIADRRAPKMSAFARLQREIYRIPYGIRRWIFQAQRWLFVRFGLRRAAQLVAKH